MKLASAMVALGGLFIASTATFAAEPVGTSTSPGAMSPQGLPPATPQQQTGRSPGQMPEQATTPSSPSALDAIPPANSGTATDTSPGALSPRASGVDRPGG